ncbi:MAG TPA: ABC transporter ATP-binding protein [Pyrinomonadaceae bacterium]|jgi:subfamily B ATP-binding cassette protein MsbA
MQDFRRLLKYLKPHLGIFIVAFAAMAAVGLLESARLALIVPVFNQALAVGGETAKRSETLFNLQDYIPESGIEAWATIAGFLLAFSIFKAVADFFAQYLMARIGQTAVLQLRLDLYSHLLKQSASFFEKHRTNFLVSRLVTSAAAIELTVSATIRDMLREGIQFFCFLGAALFFNWRLTLGAMLVAPVIGILTAKFSKALRNLAHESLEGSKILTDTAQESLSNHTVVKAFRAEEREKQRFSAVAELIKRANLRSAKIASLSPQTIELVGVLSFVALLYFGQREVFAGRLDSTQFLTFLLYLFSCYDPLRKLSRLHNSLEQGFAAARHVWEVMDENLALPEKPNAVELKPLREKIEWKNVSFNYKEEHKTILRDVNLEIEAGKIVALVGESGGGKSTLTKLIPRFYDVSEGAILWDKTDIRDAKLDSLRKQIAVVTQETVLFNDTVRYNISYGKPDATETEIERAAKVAFAHEFIADLPDGYDTIVGERGIFLSGGQRQRLAIARAVLSDAPVLILDEATSALDSESERLVQKALENLLENRTAIVIAHRLSTIRRADKIVVMERGRIAETGSHEELLVKNGIYRRLYELQFETVISQQLAVNKD